MIIHCHRRICVCGCGRFAFGCTCLLLQVPLWASFRPCQRWDARHSSVVRRHHPRAVIGVDDRKRKPGEMLNFGLQAWPWRTAACSGCVSPPVPVTVGSLLKEREQQRTGSCQMFYTCAKPNTPVQTVSSAPNKCYVFKFQKILLPRWVPLPCATKVVTPGNDYSSCVLPLSHGDCWSAGIYYAEAETTKDLVSLRSPSNAEKMLPELQFPKYLDTSLFCCCFFCEGYR